MDVDSDAEESLEPKLKYERIGGDLQNIFSKDTLSCLTVHSKFIAFGTTWGILHIVDHLGNSINVKELAMHSSTVNQVSIDLNGDYIASCAHDGRVIINGLYMSEQNYVHRFDIEVKSIALNPNFGKPHVSKHFVVGLDKVIMFEKSIFGRKMSTIYQGGYGIIETLKWHNNYIAWADQKAVKVYDTHTSSIIGTVNREFWGGEIFPCHMTWYPGACPALLLGWGDTLKVCQIASTTLGLPHSPLNLLSEISGNSSAQVKYLQIVSSFRTHFHVCGLVPYPDVNTIAVLAYVKEDEKEVKFLHPPDGALPSELAPEAVEATPSPDDPEAGSPIPVGHRPQLHVITPRVDHYEESVNDALSTKDWPSTKSSEYHLDGLPAEGYLFVGSPRDIVIGRARSAVDHVDWLLRKQLFAAALKYSSAATASAQGSLPPSTVDHVTRAYLEHLVTEGSWMEAADHVIAWYPSAGLDGDDGERVKKRIRAKEMWTDVVYKFAQARKLYLLLEPGRFDAKSDQGKESHYLPLGRYERGEIELEPACYHLVLAELINVDRSEELAPQDAYNKFLEIMELWPSKLYNVPLVINLVLDRLASDAHNPALQQGLALLYIYDGKFNKALEIYMRLKLEQAFDLIVERELFADIKDKITPLLALNQEKTLNLLVDNRIKISLNQVVQQLEDRPEILLKYLDKLFDKDFHFGKAYHGLQVKLYAEFLPEKLMSFLKTSQHYPLQKALEECLGRSLYQEAVYIYGRMGNSKEAIKIMIYKLGDIEGAINFCKEQDDSDLWNELIRLSVDDPKFVTILLQNIGTYVDPLILIKQIKPTMKIEGLRDSIVKILQDYHLQIALREDSKKILLKDVDLLFRNKYKAMTKSLTLGSWPVQLSNAKSSTSPFASVKCGSCQLDLFSKPNFITSIGMKQASSTHSLKSMGKRSKSPSSPPSQGSGKGLEGKIAKSGKEQLLYSDIVFYHCDHVFHSACLPTAQPFAQERGCSKVNCPVCSSVSESLAFTTS